MLKHGHKSAKYVSALTAEPRLLILSLVWRAVSDPGDGPPRPVYAEACSTDVARTLVCAEDCFRSPPQAFCQRAGLAFGNLALCFFGPSHAAPTRREVFDHLFVPLIIIKFIEPDG